MPMDVDIDDSATCAYMHLLLEQFLITLDLCRAHVQ